MHSFLTGIVTIVGLLVAGCNSGQSTTPDDSGESGPISRPTETGVSTPGTTQQPSASKPGSEGFIGLTMVASNEKLPECTPSRSGQVIYVKSDAAFKSCEEKDWIVLDLRGPKGDRGDAGPIGPAGVQGPQGAAGPQGAIGATGLQGLPGATGPQGPAGGTGPQGLQGPVGPQGPAGPQGLLGPQGVQGIAGAAGAKGDPGDRILGGNLVTAQSDVIGVVEDVMEFYGHWSYGAADQFLLVKKGNYRTIYQNPLYYLTFYDGYPRQNTLYLRGSLPRGNLARRMNDGNDRGFFQHYFIYESTDCSGTAFVPGKIPDGITNFIDLAAPHTGTNINSQSLPNWTAINTFDGMNVLYPYNANHDFTITQDCKTGQRDGAYFNSIKRPGLACERVCAATSASVRDYSICVGGQPANFTGCPITLVPKEFPDEISAGWSIVPP